MGLRWDGVRGGIALSVNRDDDDLLDLRATGQVGSAIVVSLLGNAIGAWGNRENLQQDYRMMVALMLFDPIQDAVRGSSAA